MKAYILYAVAVIIFLGCCLVSCQNTPENPKRAAPDYLENVSIPSINTFYPLSLQEAQIWDREAGLDKIDIDVMPNPETKRMASLVFHSKNLPSEFLFVEYFVLEQITSRPDEYHFAVQNFNFIEVDKVIDAPEAWQIFINNTSVIRHPKDDFECARLLLFWARDAEITVWRLAVGGKCGASEHTFYHIDAYTGEFIEQ